MPSHWSEYDIDGSVDVCGEFGMAVLSFIFNIYVFVYHSFLGPHPKHLLTRRSRISIGFHMLSGMINVLIPIFCFFLDYEGATYDSCVYTLLALDIIHTATAFYQISGLFGMRFVMRPSYGFVISSKFAAGIYWALDTKSLDRLKMYYFLISIYGWVRIYFAVFQYTRIFLSNLYSISVILAGLTCFPLAFGAWFNVILLLLCGVYRLCYEYREYLFRNGKLTQSEVTIFLDETEEKHRHIHLSSPIMTSALRWMGYLSLKHGNPEHFQDKERAMVVFDVVDENGDGTISWGELTELLRTFGQEPRRTRKLLREVRKKIKKDYIGFGDFLQHFEPVWSFIFDELLSEIRQQSALDNLTDRSLKLMNKKSSSEPILRSKDSKPDPLQPIKQPNRVGSPVDPAVIEVQSPMSSNWVSEELSPSPSTFEIQGDSLPQSFYKKKGEERSREVLVDARKRTSTMATAVESETFESVPSLPEEPHRGPVEMSQVDLNLVKDFKIVEVAASPKKMLRDIRPNKHKNASTQVPVYTTPDGGDIEKERRLMGKLVHANELKNKSAPGFSERELPESMLNFWDDDL